MQKFEVLHRQISTPSHLLASQPLAYVQSSKNKFYFLFLYLFSLFYFAVCASLALAVAW